MSPKVYKELESKYTNLKQENRKLSDENEALLSAKTAAENEVKQLQIRYGDINIKYTDTDFKGAKNHVLKLLAINLFQLKIEKVTGYLKKYKIFEDAIRAISKSRNQNMQIGAHYLDR